MKKQTIIWTALPNGIVGEGQRLRLAVLVSPRLDTNEGLPKPQLSQFPDWLDWPSRLPATVQVAFSGGPTLTGDVTPVASNLWAALFKPTTFVRPYQFKKLDDRWIRSYPARHVLGFVRDAYSALAVNNPIDHPELKDLTGLVRELARPFVRNPKGDEGDPDAHLEEQINGQLAQMKAVPASPTPNPQLDFYQLRRFHKPRQEVRRALVLPEIDFHQMLASLTDYPLLMRQMGLVLDVEVDLDESIPASGFVQVDSGFAGSGSTDLIHPRTAYQLGPDRFLAAPRPSSPELEDGLLKLGPGSGYDLVQVDVDGAGTKLFQHVQSMVRAQRHRTFGTPQAYSVPSLRTAGISLVRSGRASAVVSQIAATAALNTAAGPGSPPTLYAEDLVSGYRCDVWDEGIGRWRSLLARSGEYRFTESGDVVTGDDEGAVTMGMTQSSDGSSPDLYLHESLLRWDGWSLAAPRPGRLIAPDEQVAEPSNPASTEFKLETSFKPLKGSLPKLRFGHLYRMRARAVDVAGGSLPLEPDTNADFSKATDAHQFGRYEPVPSPVLALRAEPGPGESLEHMAIRSNYDTPAAGATDRHLAPPRTTEQMAEAHGMLDEASGLRKAAYAQLTALDGHIADDSIHPEDQLTLPYLPDPVARGAAFVGLPGATPGAAFLVDFGPDGSWPGLAPFRLEIAEGSGPPAWDPIDRVLIALLPKAEIAQVRFSTHLSPPDLEQMGIWHWIQLAGPPPATLNNLRLLALSGRHWMISPFRTLALVHAVQQPLEQPVYQTLAALKSLGNPFASLVDTMKVEGRSTGRIDVKAEWQEPVDALSEPIWKLVTGKAQPFGAEVSYGATSLAVSGKHEFGDTKYRRVAYSAVATTRFEEYFHLAESEMVSFSGITPKNLGFKPVVSGSERVLAGDGSVRIRGTDYLMDYVEGTVTRLASGAIADGEMLRVEYKRLPGPITRETAAPVELDVLNSARPAAPRLLYMVPTFGWKSAPVDGGVGVLRAGGGLRVYMDRPWFSSGDGELLGVLLWVPGPGRAPGIINRILTPTRPPDSLKPYVTQWGMDPIWESAAPVETPASGHFPLKVAVQGGLTLEEVANQTFTVVGHKPEYDPDRKLWYCDVNIEAGKSYYPFVRLALVRYQPKSVPNAHLSRVVLADFAQLAPDRLATVTSDPSEPTKVTVSLCGPGYWSTHLGKGTSEVEVCVEVRHENVDGELGWFTVPNGCFPLSVIQDDKPEITWLGQVTLPEPMGTRPFRLVIKEYERLAIDGASAVGNNVAPTAIILPPPPPTARRLVFAAAVEV